jgi:hypothetical protein
LRRRGIPVVDHEFLDSYRMDTEEKPARLAQLLRDLPAGLSEWAMHPGLGHEESRAIDPHGWGRRRTDYEFLTSPEARELVRHERITVIDYRAIQQAWSLHGVL